MQNYPVGRQRVNNWSNIFLNSQPKRDSSFEHPKHMFQLRGLKIIQFYALYGPCAKKTCLQKRHKLAFSTTDSI